MGAARQALPRFLQKGKAETLSLAWYANGILAAPTSGTYTLSDADGTAVITAAAVTVASQVATYALGATALNAYTLPQGSWRESWALTVSGVVETVEREVMVCRVAPVQHLVQDDLYRMHSDWSRLLPPGRTSYDEPIQAAWEELLQRMLGQEIIPHQVLNWWAVTVVHKYWAASIICRDFSTGETRDGRWGQLSKAYEQRANEEYDRLFLKKDNDEDGVADSSTTQQAAEPELFLTSIPTGFRRGRY